MASRRGQGTSIMNWIVAAVAIIVALVLVVLVYGRVSGGLNAVGSAQVSAETIPGGLQVEITAVGGGVTVNGIVILDPSGNVLYAGGTTPGYSAPSSSVYTFSGLYINGQAGTASYPFSMPNGHSATLIFSGSPTGDTPATVIVFYNHGKTAEATVSS